MWRVVCLQCGSLLDVSKNDVEKADVIVCEIQIPEQLERPLAHLLTRMKKGARLLTYELNLNAMFERVGVANPFASVLTERLPVTWGCYCFAIHTRV